MAVMIEVLRDEHRNMGRLLRALEHQIEIFANSDAPDYDVIVGVADYFLDYPDRCHHPKEDLVASKLIERSPAAAEMVEALWSDHKALRQRARRFRETVSALLNDTDIPRSHIVDAGRAFIAAQQRHMLAEEERFLPLVDRLLTRADWADVDGRLREGIDPLFGGKVEEAFRTLSARLLAWEAEDERAPS